MKGNLNKFIACVFGNVIFIKKLKSLALYYHHASRVLLQELSKIIKEKHSQLSGVSQILGATAKSNHVPSIFPLCSDEKRKEGTRHPLGNCGNVDSDKIFRNAQR